MNCLVCHTNCNIDQTKGIWFSAYKKGMKSERRQFDRCNVEADAIEVFIRPSKKAYPSENIGKGGLAFEYSPCGGEKLE